MILTIDPNFLGHPSKVRVWFGGHCPSLPNTWWVGIPTPKHLLKRPRKGVQLSTQRVFGSFWKTRIRSGQMVVYWGISKNMFTPKIGGNATFLLSHIFQPPPKGRILLYFWTIWLETSAWKKKHIWDPWGYVYLHLPLSLKKTTICAGF